MPQLPANHLHHPAIIKALKAQAKARRRQWARRKPNPAIRSQKTREIRGFFFRHPTHANRKLWYN